MVPEIRKAILDLRKNLEKKRETKESIKGLVDSQRQELEPNDPLLTSWGKDGQLSYTELGRLIEATYLYIYSVEDMRLQRRIDAVEELF